MFKGFTNRCKKIINYYGVFEMERYNHSVIQPEHILIALLKEGQSNAYTVMCEVIDLIHFQLILESYIGKMKDDVVAENTDILLYYNINLAIQISERTKNIFQIAIEESSKIGAKQIDTFSLFLACCEEEGSISRAIIMRHEVMVEDIRNNYYKYIRSSEKKNFEIPNIKNIDKLSKRITDSNLPEVKNVRFQKFIKNFDVPGFKSNNISDYNNKNTEEKLDNYSTLEEKTPVPSPSSNIEYIQDMTLLAKEGKIIPIYGRDTELNQMYRVLLRKQKNNPVLVGDTGVGKTAIVEELALRIVEGRVPLPLLNATILQLDLAALTAGTRYRGDFEERLLNVLEEIQSRKVKNQQAILFIDEFHHIIGSGLATGLSMDGAGILKPALARGEISCIGITTAEEYRKYIESDKAFLRRLQKIEISEMSDDDTYCTLQKIKPYYEKIHNVIYTDDTLKEIIRLAKNYIFDRYFPDKAVDLLDEIGAYNKMLQFDTPKELSELFIQEQKISKDVKDILGKIGDNKYHELHTSHIQKSDELQSIIDRKKKLHKSLLRNVEQNITTITPEHVRKVISIITSIPSDRLDINKTKSVKILELGLKQNIVGQHEAITSLVSAVKRSYVGLHKGNRPIGSFMFLGPTGVGKTYTAKQLAAYLFGSVDALTRFDMSDFAESNSINRLVGAPPGYVGYEESGLLLKILRRNPRQILLFDEIEKAHSRVFDIFLQILEEGTLQGQMGEQADFRHSLIVMTSNIGSRDLLKKPDFGFGEEAYGSDFIKNIVCNELSKQFRPEFINRFDEIITFDPLGDKEIIQVIELLCQELVNTLSDQNILVNLQAGAKKLLFSKYYNIDSGARSIRRGIRDIENLIAEIMIEKEMSGGGSISVGVKNDDFIVKLVSSQKNSILTRVEETMTHM